MLRTRISRQDSAMSCDPEQLGCPSRGRSRRAGRAEDGGGREPEARRSGAGIGVAETGEDQGQERGGEGGRVPRPRLPAAAAASRVGYSEPRYGVAEALRRVAPSTRDATRRPTPARPSRGPMFRPVSAKPDLVAQEHEILAQWAERRTFARLRAQNAGGPALELPRRADHGQQPDGRPPRLGPDVQGPLPALPRDARRGPALPERLRLPGPVGRGQRRARPRLHEQARHRGVRHRRVREPVQAARPDLRRPPDRAVASGSASGWTGTTPHELRRLRDLLAADPAQRGDDRGPGRAR